METLLCLLLAIVPYEGVAVDSVDNVERNWVVDEKGEFIFCQLLFCDVCLNTGERRIREWRFVSVERGAYEGIPYAAAIGPHVGKRMIWDDKGTLRDIRVGFTTETVTQFDPERFEEERFPKNWRRGFGELPQPRSRVRGR